jgi:carboxyl-terminal processing protease
MRLARIFCLCVLIVACARVVPARQAALISPLAVTTFDSAWALVNTTYFDSTFGGNDWNGVKAVLRPQAASATTTEALRAVIRRMLDTLGESHARILVQEVQPSTTGSAVAEPGIDVRPTARGMLIARIDSGSPAAAAGVRPGWLLDTIDGQSASGSTRRVLSARLRGDSGTAVSVVLQDLAGHVRKMSLARVVPAGIFAGGPNLPPRIVRFRVATISSSSHANIGLIQFDQWLLPIAAALDSAIHELRDSRGLIIDLRGNSGGLGSMVAGFAGYFVDTATAVGIVRTRQSELRLVAHPRVAMKSGGGGNPFGGPLAILVDRFTGSASEVFASGMQSAGRARLFGDTTAGAVLPSALDRLPNGDVLQHPIADFVTLAGVRLEGRGVRPDEPVIPTPKDYVNNEDPVLSAAVRWIHTQLKTQR